MKKTILLCMFGLVCFGTAVSTTRAATIIWGSATNVTGPSDVITAGTYVDSATFFPSAFPLPAINGVTFNQYAGGFTSPHGSNAFGFDFPSSNIVVGFDGSPSNQAGPENTPYTELLAVSGIAFTSGTINLGALTVGKNYEVELWAPYINGSFTANFGGHVLNASATPQFIVGTFTADAASQVISIGIGTVGGFSFTPSAIELRAEPATTPEPGSALLLGLGGVGVVVGAVRARRARARLALG